MDSERELLKDLVKNGVLRLYQNLLIVEFIFDVRITAPTNIESELGHYFESFGTAISLVSQIYAFVSTKNASLVFEIYKKMPSMNLTVTLLCEINNGDGKIEHININNVWIRRKDLSGVHLKVGCIDNNPLISTKDTVI